MACRPTLRCAICSIGAASFDIVDEVTREQGLVTSEMVPALAADGGDGDSGPRIARHRY